MDCKRIVFSGHALRRMFERRIETDDVLHVVVNGEAVAEYPEDSPYPSWLLLGWVRGEAVHVVVARDAADAVCIVVTVYQPDPGLWEPDFRVRRMS